MQVVDVLLKRMNWRTIDLPNEPVILWSIGRLFKKISTRAEKERLEDAMRELRAGRFRKNNLGDVVTAT